MDAQINFMKKYFIISILMFSQIISFAQKSKVTIEAQKAFQTKFPTAKEVKWEMESKDDYEASFVMDGKKGSANFSGKANGWKLKWPSHKLIHQKQLWMVLIKHLQEQPSKKYIKLSLKKARTISK